MEGITIFRVYILQKLTIERNALNSNIINSNIINPFFTTLALKGKISLPQYKYKILQYKILVAWKLCSSNTNNLFKFNL